MFHDPVIFNKFSSFGLSWFWSTKTDNRQGRTPVMVAYVQQMSTTRSVYQRFQVPDVIKTWYVPTRGRFRHVNSIYSSVHLLCIQINCIGGAMQVPG